jgi:hypothetical protein
LSVLLKRVTACKAWSHERSRVLKLLGRGSERRRYWGHIHASKKWPKALLTHIEKEKVDAAWGEPV